MLKNLTQIYSLIICLVSTIILMITLGVMFNSATDILLTEYKNVHTMDKFSSNDKYIEYKTSYNKDDKRFELLGGEEIKIKRLQEKEDYINNRKKEAIGTLISCMTWLFISALFFIVHWRMHKKYAMVN